MRHRDPPTPAEADEIAREMFGVISIGALSFDGQPAVPADFIDRVSVLADVLAYSRRPELGEALAEALQNVRRGESTPWRDLPNAYLEVEQAFLRGRPINLYAFLGGSIVPPKRVRILRTNTDRTPFIAAGGYGIAEAWSLRGGNHCKDGGVSEPGERTYVVAKRPGGGALWYRASALRFVRSAPRGLVR